jgi:GNAT superfamily N-acetyltransferase
MNDPALIRRAAQTALPVRNPFGEDGFDASLVPHIFAAADAPAIQNLHEGLFAKAPAGTLRHDSPDFFHRILAGNGVILGLKTMEGVLVAYGVLSLPTPEEFHYGRLIELPEACWPQIAQLEGIGVAPHWHGQGIQKWLGLWRMNTAVELGYCHVCATAAPRNFYSWRNLLALDLAIRGLHSLYGGFQRYVLHRDIHATVDHPLDLEVPVDDYRKQMEIFAAGGIAWGWRGAPRPEVLLVAMPGDK